MRCNGKSSTAHLFLREAGVGFIFAVLSMCHRDSVHPLVHLLRLKEGAADVLCHTALSRVSYRVNSGIDAGMMHA